MYKTDNLNKWQILELINQVYAMYNKNKNLRCKRRFTS